MLFYVRLPTSFLPDEDQGYMIVNVQLPPGATQNRTLEVMKQVEDYILKQPEVREHGQRARLQLLRPGPERRRSRSCTLKDWDEREGAEHSAQALAGRAFGALSSVRDAFIFPLSPPPIPELGTASGFNFRLQDRGGNGHDALLAARNQLLGMAAQSKLLAGVRPDGLEDAPQLQLDDRPRQGQRARACRFDAINAAHLDRARLDATSTTSPTPGACSASWCRPTPRRACSPTTCCASTRINARASWCRCRRSPPRAG